MQELTAPTLADIVEAVETLCEISAQRGEYDAPEEYAVTDYDGRPLAAAEISPGRIRLRFAGRRPAWKEATR